MAEATSPVDQPEAGPAVAPRLTWQTPASWKEASPGDLRVASFQVSGPDGKQADVSVIPLPGAAGGDFSNVNRWRGQVGQPPVLEDDLKKLAQPVELAGQSAVLYEQDGQNPAGAPTRILAVIQHRADTAWFFKMTGDSQLVAREKQAFVQFLKSVQFVPGGTAPALAGALPAMPAGGLPAGHPDLPAGSPIGAEGIVPAPTASREGAPRWTAPANWKEVSGGQFLIAKFVITGAGSAQAAVNVSSSAGDGGGLAANVNRWRKQLGLPGLAGDDLAKSTQTIETTSGSATLVMLNGTDARSGQPAALIGVMVLRPGQAWFYKLMGDATVVDSQKDAFTHFVQGAKY